MFRFYNPYTYEHLYTTDVKEAADLRSRGWNAEGIGWYSPVKDTPGVVKIYRLYNPYGDDHLYTTEEKEKDDNIKRGWKLDATFEAYGFISKQLGANAGISRLFNPYEKYHTHLFSANKKELEDNIKRGWRDEQVRWYVPGKPAETTSAATDTDVNVTGSGSGSSDDVVTPSTPSKPTPKPVTPTPSKPAETSKPAQTSKYSEAARKDIFGNKAPDAAITDLTTAAKTAETEVTNLKEKGTATNATPEDRAKYNTAVNKKAEADFKVDYATKVKTLNEAAAALKKSQNDPKLKEAYDKALKEVEADENKFTPVTYTVHFKNDPQGNTGQKCSLKDMQVTIYKCIATQMYQPDIDQSGTLAKFYSISTAIESTNVIPGQNKSYHVRYDDAAKQYTVEYGTWQQYQPIQESINWTLSNVAPDANAPKDLPELNFSMLAKDTSIFHTTKDDDRKPLQDQINKNTAILEANFNNKVERRYETLDSYRAYKMAEELFIYERTKEAYDAEETAFQAFFKDVTALPYYTLPGALTSKDDPNLALQTAWLKLKVAEIDYKQAKTDDAKLEARKNAAEAAADLMLPDYLLEANIQQHVDRISTKDLMTIRRKFLIFLRYSILSDDAPGKDASKDAQSKYQAYVDAYTTWMNMPTKQNMAALKNAEKTYKDLVTGKKMNGWDLNDILRDGI